MFCDKPVFLELYKLVSVSYDHNRGAFVASSKGSVVAQHPTKPWSSAGITVSYLSLNCEMVRSRVADKKCVRTAMILTGSQCKDEITSVGNRRRVSHSLTVGRFR